MTNIAASFLGATGSNGRAGIQIRSDLETQTRAIADAMEIDASDFDWSMFFMRSGGSMSSSTHDLMMMAHKVAISQSADRPARDPGEGGVGGGGVGDPRGGDGGPGGGGGRCDPHGGGGGPGTKTGSAG